MRIKSDSPNRAGLLRLAARMAEEAELFGANVRALREDRKMSQRELAEALPGKTEGKDISRYETGKHMPGQDTRVAIARALGVPLARLYEEAEKPEAETPDLMGQLGSGESVAGLAQRIESLRTELLAEIGKMQKAQATLLRQTAPASRSRAKKRS